MRADDAIRELQVLMDGAARLESEAGFLGWTSKSRAVLRAALGPDSQLLRDFERAVVVKNEGYTLAGGARRDLEAWRADAGHRGKAVLGAAIYTLELLTDDNAGLLEESSIDPELWTHVQGLVTNDDWAKVPAAVAIFVEDKIRTWAGDPRQGSGAVTVGQALYGEVLGHAGILRLGGQASESDGWRNLGLGLAAACGNVDRHRIQLRPDVKRYAMGVLGLGSLLLTQIRYERGARVQEAEALAATDVDPEGG